MFYSMTRFNAHLEDGPTTPLTKWLRGLNPQNIDLIKELNIWDLHHLNGTLYGSETAAEKLQERPPPCALRGEKKYILRPLDNWVFAKYGTTKTWKDIMIALYDVGFGLLQLCVVDVDYEDSYLDDLNDTELGEVLVAPTSSFALVRLDSRPLGEIFTDRSTNIEWLARSAGISEAARAEMIRGLAEGEIVVEVVDGMRRIVVDFTSLELGGKIVEGNVEDVESDLTAVREKRKDLALAYRMLKDWTLDDDEASSS